MGVSAPWGLSLIASAVQWLLEVLAIPDVGLSTVFIMSLLSATLLPLGSEPAVFGVVKINPTLFWPTLGVATLGNTLGGIIDYWLGSGAQRALAPKPANKARWSDWLQRFGPKGMLLSWLPVVGDPLCTLAGWWRLPFWPCVLYMAIGKFMRYLVMTSLLLYVPDSVWLRLGGG